MNATQARQIAQPIADRPKAVDREYTVTELLEFRRRLSKCIADRVNRGGFTMGYYFRSPTSDELPMNPTQVALVVADLEADGFQVERMDRDWADRHFMSHKISW